YLFSQARTAGLLMMLSVSKTSVARACPQSCSPVAMRYEDEKKLIHSSPVREVTPEQRNRTVLEQGDRGSRTWVAMSDPGRVFDRNVHWLSLAFGSGLQESSDPSFMLISEHGRPRSLLCWLVDPWRWPNFRCMS